MSARTVVVLTATESSEVTVRDGFYLDRTCPYVIHVSSSGGADVYLSSDAAESVLGMLFDRLYEREPARAEELLDKMVEVVSTDPQDDDGSDAYHDMLQDQRIQLETDVEAGL